MEFPSFFIIFAAIINFSSAQTRLTCSRGAPFMYPGNPIYGPLVCISRCPPDYQCLPAAETGAVRLCCDPTKPGTVVQPNRQNLCSNGYPPIQDTCVPMCPVASSCFLVGNSYKCCVNETVVNNNPNLFGRMCVNGFYSTSLNCQLGCYGGICTANKEIPTLWKCENCPICPNGGQSQGPCFGGVICSAGSTCIEPLKVCCPSGSGIPQRCVDGREPAGACFNGLCPLNYVCDYNNNLCCPSSYSMLH